MPERRRTRRRDVAAAICRWDARRARRRNRLPYAAPVNPFGHLMHGQGADLFAAWQRATMMAMQL